MKKITPDIGYDEIRAENSSWQKRRDYVQASKIVIFDKGEGLTGRGAILSSTAYQVIGWGTPILARDNLFFSPFKNGELVKYRNNKELAEAVRMLLHDNNERVTTPRAPEVANLEQRRDRSYRLASRPAQNPPASSPPGDDKALRLV